MDGLTGSGKAETGLSRPSFSHRAARTLPGLLLCACIALPANELSRYHSSLDALAISLILGIILRNVLGPVVAFQSGVRLVTQVFIPVGVVFYGSRLDLLTFTKLPVYTTLIVVGGMIAFYMTICGAGRLLGMDPGTRTLMAAGTAICGASAIAVLSPVTRARSKDTSMALIVITTAGLAGVLIYPAIATILSMPANAFAVFSGATLQQTGLVKLAASQMGADAVLLAVTVKMVRVAMLAPMALILAATLLKAENGPAGNGHTLGVAFKRVWFIPLFIASALIFSFYAPATAIKGDIEPLATIFLSLALASIGLTVDFDSIRTKGPLPLMIGFFGWLAVSIVLAIVIGYVYA